MSKSEKAAKSVAIIIYFSFVSKFLGYARESLIANKYGSGYITDTFFISLSAIALFTTMITKAINTTMIPVLADIETKKGKEGKLNHTNNLLNIISLISILLMIVAWILSPVVIKIIGSGFEGEQFKLAVLLMRIGLPTMFFASMEGTFRGYLQSESMFFESAISAFPYNLIYIFFLLFLSSKFDIRGLMIVSVIAVLGKVLIQYPSLRKSGFKYKFELNFTDKYVRKMISLMPPVLISATIEDINNIVDKSMASNLVEGSVSALQYGKRLDSIIRGTFISAVNTVIYPMFSKDASSEGYKELKKTIIHGMNIVMLITIPATIGVIILAHPIVKIAFERGKFDSTATYMTMGALMFYSVGLVASSMKSMVNRAYYSLQDTKTPMNNSIIALGLNIVLNLILIKYMEHAGLALATSLSTIITLIYLLYKLRIKIGPFGLLSSVKTGLKSLTASIIMGIVVYFLYDIISIRLGIGTLYELTSLLVSVGAGALAYGILIYIFKIEEVNWAIKLIKDKIRRQ